MPTTDLSGSGIGRGAPGGGSMDIDESSSRYAALDPTSGSGSLSTAGPVAGRHGMPAQRPSSLQVCVLRYYLSSCKLW